MSLITHKNQKGFTLLEIMVTVAIVGILAAIAIPIYNNYMTKTRIAEALEHGRVHAGKVTIDREDHADPPAKVEYSKIKLAGSQKQPRVRIKSKENIDSAVLIDPDHRAGGKVMVLSEQSSGASIRWACLTNLPQALIPEGCTYDGAVENRKLLAEWTAGNEACWSPEREARGKSGWTVGSCTSCRQFITQRRAAAGWPGIGVGGWSGATCSGQYVDDETLAEAAAAKMVSKYFPALARKRLARIIESYRAARLWAESPELPVAAFVRLKALLLSGRLIDYDAPYQRAVPAGLSDASIWDPRRIEG